MKIVIIAGGSGGHIFPALAVASELPKKTNVTYLTSYKKLDRNILRANGTNFLSIFSGKWRRYFSLWNIIDPFFIVLGFLQSFLYLLFLRPQVILSKGGFVSLPPVFAAKLLRIPVVLHESDATMGLANRMVHRMATRTLSAFSVPGAEQIGLPLRKEAFEKAGKVFFPLDKKNLDSPLLRGVRGVLKKEPQKPTLFAFFGSQGAESLNAFFLRNAEAISEKANVLWVFGPKHMPQKKLPENVRGFPFLHGDFFAALQSADLVLARSGSSVFEIAAAGKPMLLFPLMSSANHHQLHNAKSLAEQEAALVIEQREEGDQDKEILQKLFDLLEDEVKRKKLATNAKKLASPGAAKKVSGILMGYKPQCT